MINKYGFSLAEALITLLIVCVIAIVSAPILTKKARKLHQEQVWIVSPQYETALYPSANRNIMLGNINSNHAQSIIVSGRLEFKNRAGQTIGWIDEDGTSSFGSSSGDSGIDYQAMMENQKRIYEMLTMLKGMLVQQSQNQDNSKISKRRSRNSNNDQISEEELQRQLDYLIQNMNNNVYKK